MWVDGELGIRFYCKVLQVMVKKQKIQSRDVYVQVDEINIWEIRNWVEIYVN